MKTNIELTNSIYDKIEDKFFLSGFDSLSSHERELFSALTFVGQMRNGGLCSVTEEPWFVILPHVVHSLRAIGMEDLAQIVETMLDAAQDSPEMEAYDETLDGKFWEFYHGGGKDSFYAAVANFVAINFSNAK